MNPFTLYLGAARNTLVIRRRLVRWFVMWWDVALVALIVVVAVVAAARYLEGQAVIATNNDELARLRTENDACAEIKKLATAIDNTPTGSRTDAGRVLANNTITNQGRK